MLKTHHKFNGLILTLAIVAAIFFGMNAGMDMRQDGTMSGCIFDQSVTCSMDYSEHWQHWQQTITAIQPSQNNLLALLIIVFVGVPFFAAFSQWQNFVQLQSVIPKTQWRQRNIIAKLSDHILQALSDGILNPKIYNLSTIS
ncbi:hypothetical protein BK004_02740 [bacterium CG10_46_32]|nr:MAG: hypothetical protein BK004_02740 [bacterium CG10_46_32]PIR56063.1 MAG: hypothetical protein COU73_02770 [Parcubacteria group bacterium CG10_big_fil_rev_8_21_14_0_10_46_32]